MALNLAKHTSIKKTPQTQKIPGREAEMVINNAGGAVFELDPFAHLLRFLILGSEGGTYYASEKDHTLQAFDGLRKCIKLNARQTVDLAVDVSVKGRAAKNEAALFTIACVMAFADKPEDKHYARTQLNQVARIGTHILHFAQYINSLKGWGTGTRKAFQHWFTDKTADNIAYQFVKYGQRDGWSMRDLLRKAHPYGSVEQNDVFNYIAKGHSDSSLPTILYAAEQIKSATLKEAVQMITAYRLPREAVPTNLLNEPKIWEALLPHMKLTAIIRNLGKMTSVGVLKPLSTEMKFVVEKLTNAEELRKDRIHPVTALNAFRTYSKGKGVKGSLYWTPVGNIKDALEDTFVKSFNFVEPSGVNVLIGLDASASMTWESARIRDTFIYAREAAACMAMVTARAEKNYHIMAFANTFMETGITAKDSFNEVIRKIDRLPATSTDCAQPMIYAKRHGLDVDIFQTYTDNETMWGAMHPVQALKDYRNTCNKPKAKAAIVGMTASKFSIADPKDPYMLDFVGFDTAAPAAMSEFAKM